MRVSVSIPFILYKTEICGREIKGMEMKWKRNESKIEISKLIFNGFSCSCDECGGVTIDLCAQRADVKEKANSCDSNCSVVTSIQRATMRKDRFNLIRFDSI